MEEMKEKLSNLIKDINLEKLVLSLNVPNFFSIIGVQEREIKHSNFLAWILDPKENHLLGTTFLKWFLKDVFSDNKVSWCNEFSVDSLNLESVRVYREWKNIDILIESEDFVVSIENKIWSQEHGRQLSDYRDKVQLSFPQKKHAFVLLSPNGFEPENFEDSEVYIIYTYEQVKKNLEIIFDIYVESLSDRIKIYLEDYYIVLRRDIMKDHESIEIAKQIYLNHKEALDFIYKNKPDRYPEVLSVVRECVQDKGFILGSENKKFARFLTPALDAIIPRTGTGWSQKEAFLFEIIIEENKVTFKSVISPGDEAVRDILTTALSNIEGARSVSKESTWIVHFNYSIPKELIDQTISDNEIISFINDFLTKYEELIKNIENAIINISEQLQNTNV